MTGAERYFADCLDDPLYAAAYLDARLRICPTCGAEKEPIFIDCNTCARRRHGTRWKPWMATDQQGDDA